MNVGRLSEQKGQILLIEAVAQLSARNLDFELAIVGDGPLRGELERLIDHYHLRGKVWITGFLDNDAVRSELEAARRLVMPSFAEGLPVVVMEALALGRPVITTYVAGIPELVEPGRHGWLVPAGATEPLVAAMVAVLTADPKELEAMGRCGAARVAERHNVDNEVGKLVRLFVDPAVTRAVDDFQARPAISLIARGAAGGLT